VGPLAACLVLCVASAASADPLFLSAQAKIGLIEDDLARPGSRIWISAAELNAYIRVAAVEAVPQGLREPRVALGQGAVGVSQTPVQELHLAADARLTGPTGVRGVALDGSSRANHGEPPLSAIQPMDGATPRASGPPRASRRTVKDRRAYHGGKIKGVTPNG